MNLLPVGFYDLIFDEAEKSFIDANNAISYLLKEKYRLIKPPLIEFDNSYQAANDNDYLVTTDGVSGRKIALRSDITLQIKRILATRLKQQKLPLKLCYIGDVIRAKSEDLYADRQQTQIGFEIIGIKKDEQDLLVIKNLVEILQKIEVNDLSFNIILPSFLDLFLSAINVGQKELLKTAILHKNLTDIAEICPNYCDILHKIVRFNNNFGEIIKEIKQKINLPAINLELARVEKINNFFLKNFNRIQINFDLFGDQNSEYHQDLYFEVFVPDFKYAIAKGGCYQISNQDNNILAIGATIYANYLRKIHASHNS